MNKDDIKKVLSANTKILKKYKVNSIALFGSYVRNEQNENSDIDFLVEFGEGITLFDIVMLEAPSLKYSKKRLPSCQKED